jgi:hypothetical protein
MVWAVIGSQGTWWQPVDLLQRERRGRRGCPETSVSNYQSIARNTSEERGSQGQGFSQSVCSSTAGSSQESKQEFPERKLI